MRILNQQPKTYRFLFAGNPLQRKDMDSAYNSAIKMQERKESLLSGKTIDSGNYNSTVTIQEKKPTPNWDFKFNFDFSNNAEWDPTVSTGDFNLLVNEAANLNGGIIHDKNRFLEILKDLNYPENIKQMVYRFLYI